MTTYLIIALLVVGIASLFGDRLFSLAGSVSWPSLGAYSRKRRMLELIDMAKRLEAVGAKAAAAKVKQALSALVDEDYLQ